MSAYFSENLSAPLVNVQWSWGAENDKGIYLRVWKDEIENDNEVLVLLNSAAESRLGHIERQKHLKSIAQGKPGYVVVITKWMDTADESRKITEFDESVFRITDLIVKDNGDEYAVVDFDNPIYPEFIGQEIDLDRIKVAASKVKKSAELLDKAMTKFHWKPTSICDSEDVIRLLSKDGKHKAKIIISSSEWVRL